MLRYNYNVKVQLLCAGTVTVLRFRNCLKGNVTVLRYNYYVQVQLLC